GLLASALPQSPYQPNAAGKPTGARLPVRRRQAAQPASGRAAACGRIAPRRAQPRRVRPTCTRTRTYPPTAVAADRTDRVARPRSAARLGHARAHVRPTALVRDPAPR